MGVYTGEEKLIGHWRRSTFTGGFWWRTIVTLGLYWLILWRRNQITVTTHRVMQRHGNILGGSETAISIENVTDISINVPALGAILGYGDIRIQSAGSDTAEIAFKGLAGVKKLREVLFDLKDGKIGDTAKEMMEKNN